jgi:putative membrane protein
MAVCTVFALIRHKTANAAPIPERFFLHPLGGGGTMVVSRFRVAALAVAACSLAACGKKDNNAADTTAASSTTTSMDTSSTAASSTGAGGTWSDANIVALLDEANQADSSAGSIASTKGTAGAVRTFGRDMMRDHHQLRAQGAALAKKLNITPAAPSDDPVAPMAQSETNTLNSTAKGKDFDKAYIDAEVGAHKAVLDLATKAAGQTQNAELKNLIQKAAPIIQAHLDKAEAIQKTLK